MSSLVAKLPGARPNDTQTRRRKYRPRTVDILQDLVESLPLSPKLDPKEYLDSLDRTLLIPTALSTLKQQEEQQYYALDTVSRLRNAAMRDRNSSASILNQDVKEKTIFGASGGVFLVPPRQSSTASKISSQESNRSQRFTANLKLSAKPSTSNASSSSVNFLSDFATAQGDSIFRNPGQSTTVKSSFQRASGEDLSSVMFPPNPDSEDESSDGYGEDFAESDDDVRDSKRKPTPHNGPKYNSSSRVTPEMLEYTPYVPSKLAGKLSLGDIPAIRSAYQCSGKDKRSSLSLNEPTLSESTPQPQYPKSAFPLTACPTTVDCYARLNPFDELIPKESLDALNADEARAERLKLSAAIRSLTARHEKLKKAMFKRGEFVKKLQERLEEDAKNREAELKHAVENERIAAVLETEEKLKNELEQARRERDSAVREIQKALSEVKKQQTILSEHGSELADAKSALEIQMKLAQQRSSELTKCRAESSELTDKLHECELKVLDLDSRYKQIRAEYDEHKENVHDQLQKEYANGVLKLEEATKKSADKLLNLEDEIARLQAENKTLNESLELNTMDWKRKLKDASNRSEVQGRKMNDEFVKIAEKHKAEIEEIESKYVREIEKLHIKLKSEQVNAEERGKEYQITWEEEKEQYKKQIKKLEAGQIISKLASSRHDFFERIRPMIEVDDQILQQDSSNTLQGETPIIESYSKPQSMIPESSLQWDHKDELFYDSLIEFITGLSCSPDNITRSQSNIRLPGQKIEDKVDDIFQVSLMQSTSDLQGYTRSISRGDESETYESQNKRKNTSILSKSSTFDRKGRDSTDLGEGVGSLHQKVSVQFDIDNTVNNEVTDPTLEDLNQTENQHQEDSYPSSSFKDRSKRGKTRGDNVNQTGSIAFSTTSSSSSSSSSSASSLSIASALEIQKNMLGGTAQSSLSCIEVAVALLIRKFLTGYMQENPPPSSVATSTEQSTKTNQNIVPPLQLPSSPTSNEVQNVRGSPLIRSVSRASLGTPSSTVRTMSKTLHLPPSPEVPATVFSTLKSSNTPPPPRNEGSSSLQENVIEEKSVRVGKKEAHEHHRTTSILGDLPVSSLSKMTDLLVVVDPSLDGGVPISSGDSQLFETQSVSRRSVRSSTSSTATNEGNSAKPQNASAQQQYYERVANAVQTMIYVLMQSMFKTLSSLPLLPPCSVNAFGPSNLLSPESSATSSSLNSPNSPVNMFSTGQTSKESQSLTPRRRSNSTTGAQQTSKDQIVNAMAKSSHYEKWVNSHMQLSKSILGSVLNTTALFAVDLGLGTIESANVSSEESFDDTNQESTEANGEPTTVKSMAFAPESLLNIANKRLSIDLDLNRSILNDVSSALENAVSHILSTNSSSVSALSLNPPSVSGTSSSAISAASNTTLSGTNVQALGSASPTIGPTSTKRSSGGAGGVPLSIRVTQRTQGNSSAGQDDTTPSPGTQMVVNPVNDEPVSTSRRPSFNDGRPSYSLSMRRTSSRPGLSLTGTSGTASKHYLAAAKRKLLSLIQFLLETVRAEERAKYAYQVQNASSLSQTHFNFSAKNHVTHLQTKYQDQSEDTMTATSSVSGTPSMRPSTRFKRAAQQSKQLSHLTPTMTPQSTLTPSTIPVVGNTQNLPGLAISTPAASPTMNSFDDSKTYLPKTNTPNSTRRRLPSYESFESTSSRLSRRNTKEPSLNSPREEPDFGSLFVPGGDSSIDNELTKSATTVVGDNAPFIGSIKNKSPSYQPSVQPGVGSLKKSATSLLPTQNPSSAQDSGSSANQTTSSTGASNSRATNSSGLLSSRKRQTLGIGIGSLKSVTISGNRNQRESVAHSIGSKGRSNAPQTVSGTGSNTGSTVDLNLTRGMSTFSVNENSDNTVETQLNHQLSLEQAQNSAFASTNGLMDDLFSE